MTTVAFDGQTMAADTLAVDNWGLKEKTLEKIWANKYLLIGGAGESGQIQTWLAGLDQLETDLDDLIEAGYKPYAKESNDPALLVVCRMTGRIYRHVGGRFLRSHYPQFAIGSGRDFALAAMHLGKSAREAVEVAMTFDNNTGGDVIEIGVSE